MKQGTCAYCGRVGPVEREHVIPRCLYPRRLSLTPRLTIPACRECNGSWADDEPHFRDVLAVVGEPNDAVRGIWRKKIVPSWSKADGRRRLMDLFHQAVPVKVAGKDALMSDPSKDARVMRIVRKVVRGLCHHHKLLSPVPDSQVCADILRFPVPSGVLALVPEQHREQDIFRYRFGPVKEVGFHSAWMMTFYERTHFVALVFTDPGPAKRFLNTEPPAIGSSARK